jgi:hypothetical protein
VIVASKSAWPVDSPGDAGNPGLDGHAAPPLRATARGSKLTVSNRAKISALNRLPRRIRSTPESPGPPGPNASVSTCSAGCGPAAE